MFQADTPSSKTALLPQEGESNVLPFKRPARTQAALLHPLFMDRPLWVRMFDVACALLRIADRAAATAMIAGADAALSDLAEMIEPDVEGENRMGGAVLWRLGEIAEDLDDVLSVQAMLTLDELADRLRDAAIGLFGILDQNREDAA